MISEGRFGHHWPFSNSQMKSEISIHSPRVYVEHCPNCLEQLDPSLHSCPKCHFDHSVFYKSLFADHLISAPHSRTSSSSAWRRLILSTALLFVLQFLTVFFVGRFTISIFNLSILFAINLIVILFGRVSATRIHRRFFTGCVFKDGSSLVYAISQIPNCQKWRSISNAVPGVIVVLITLSFVVRWFLFEKYRMNTDLVYDVGIISFFLIFQFTISLTTSLQIQRNRQV